MPRHSQSKVNNHIETEAVTRAAHPSSVVVVPGTKRNASALSAAAPAMPNTEVQTTESGDQPPPRLPPKLKESERMMHVQRWVNHLSWNGDGTSGQTKWNYWYRHIDEDRELTPPPSRTYLSRLPFTPEEQKIMARFFTPNSEYRHPQAAGAAPNTYPSNQLSYHHQRTNALHQAAAATNQHLQMSAQQQQQRQAAAAAAVVTGNPVPGNNLDLDRCGSNPKPTAVRRLEPEPTGGSRFFAEWETRLISHLFQDYFPGRPEPMGNAGALPSLNEVRSRIASSRLKETRTAMAVRAKIKRMQSSGTWIEYP
ncbi:hypothetical protein D915_007957 [Fasciola hepatica]|uniref:Uncharacterized protein n=1 Tax=Fasciola hepatica TaxID=6192 RepID=A0A4E0RXS4_FASHE|nr:hypothetical protein D915_007957 [Fasciola hepatica]